MTRDRARDLERIFHAALERPVAERDAWLTEACGGDEALRGELASLLARDEAAVSFLETPALVAAAQTMGAAPGGNVVVTNVEAARALGITFR